MLLLALGEGVTAGAQTTAEEFRAEFATGDRTACMEAGKALSALTNPEPGSVSGVDLGTALAILRSTLEKGIEAAERFHGLTCG